MPWRPLQHVAHAVCTHHYETSGPDDLTLRLGDEVYIVEVNEPGGVWCRGWLLAQPSLLEGLTIANVDGIRARAYSGIFPRSHVKLRELLDQYPRSAEAHDQGRTGEVNGASAHSRAVTTPSLNGEPRQSPLSNGLRSPSTTSFLHLDDEVDEPLQLRPLDGLKGTSLTQKEPAPMPPIRIGDSGNVARSEPLVEEISSCIREWHSTRLHGLILAHDSTLLDKMAGSVERLYNARRQLLHNLLTQKELEQLREDTIWEMVNGNKLVEGAVIVRSPAENGRILTAEDSVAEILKLQAVMSMRHEPIPQSIKEPHLLHLLVDLQHFSRQMVEPAVLHMFLCTVSSAGKATTVTEAFGIDLPLEQDVGAEHSAETPRQTLFANLSSEAIGGQVDSDSRTYLICKFYRDEPLRRASRRLASGTRAAGQTDDDSAHPPTPSRRRSGLFGSQRIRRPSDAGDTPGLSRPSTSGSLRSKMLPRQKSDTPSRSGTPGPAESYSPDPAAHASANEPRVRRAAGWSALQLSSNLRRSDGESRMLALWTPAQPTEQFSTPPVAGDDGWDEIIRSLCRSPSSHFAQTSSVGKFRIRLQAFAHDDVDSLVKQRPSLLRDLPLTPALSLNGNIRTPRSDVYLTLRQPILPHNARAYHPQFGSVQIKGEAEFRNFQVTLEVRTDSGERLENVIHSTSNRLPVTAFRTPAIDRAEIWDQTVRLSLPPGTITRAHIVMSIAEGPNFPFALAWVPLWDEKQGFPPDGLQNLALWDYSELTANSVDGRGAYQSLPSTVEQIDSTDSSAMASLSIALTLSSTSSTQNGDVLAFLRDENLDPAASASLLRRFPQIPDDELVKFFIPVLKALSRMLEQSSDVDEASATDDPGDMAEAAVHCLVRMYRLAGDRRYPALDGILTGFPQQVSPGFAGRMSVMRVLRSLVSNAFDPRRGRELRAVLKVTDRLLRYVVDPMPTDPEQAAILSDAVHREMREFFEDVMVVLTNTNTLALGTQTIIVQNFASWLPEVAPVIVGEEALGLAMAMTDACSYAQGQLRIHRLSMIYNLSCLSCFDSRKLQARLASKTMTWLRPYWPESAGTDERSLAALRIVCSIIKQQLAQLSHAQRQSYLIELFNAYFAVHTIQPALTTTASNGTDKPRVKAFSPLFPTSYPFQAVSVDTQHVPNELLLEISAVLGSIFQAQEAYAPTTNGNASHTSPALDAVDINRALYVLRSIQRAEAFPETWFSYTVAFSRCEVAMLEWVLNYLEQNLPDTDDVADADEVMEFDEALWTQWFAALFALTRSKAVTVENQSDQKRRATWTIGGDIREMAANLLQRAWLALGWSNDPQTRKLYGIDRMGGYQVHFTSDLIPSVVAMALGLHTKLSETAIGMLRTMIVSEWELSGNLDVVQSALADSFDAAFRSSRPEPSQALSFLRNLSSAFARLQSTSAKDLYSAVQKMCEECEGLIALLASVHLENDDDPASRLERRIQLIGHLSAADSEDSYVRNVHDIANLQADSRCYSAAGLALQLHLDLLGTKVQDLAYQSDPFLSKAYPDLGLEPQTLTQRKELLLTQMIGYFKSANAWDQVLSAIDQRIKVLEITFDASAMATANEQKAELYRMLNSGDGLKVSRYFRVTYGAKGFATLSGKGFIYEGGAEEDTEHFAQRMRKQHPNAIVLYPGVAATGAAADAPQLRIGTVTVNKEQLHPINYRRGISPFFRYYHLTMRPSKFATATRHERPGLSVMQQTVEKTIYSTKEPLPTISGRSEIVREEKVLQSPIQAAIDRTHRKTMDVAEANKAADAQDDDEDSRLVRIIRASVDQRATDSVAMYRSLTSDVPQSMRSSTDASQVPSERTGAEDDDERNALRKILSVALEEHVRALEHALATSFTRRQEARRALCAELESTFETELISIYGAAGRWRTESKAWIEPPPEIVAEQEAKARTPAGVNDSAIVDGYESEVEVGATPKRRPSKRRLSLRKTLSFLSLSSKN